jgi:hypothetical protein
MVYDIRQQFKQLSDGNCHDAAEYQQESSHDSKLAELAERYSGETEQRHDNASDEQQEGDDFHLPVTSLSSTIHCILRLVTPKDTLKGLRGHPKPANENTHTTLGFKIHASEWVSLSLTLSRS